MQVQSLSQEHPLEEEMGTHSNILLFRNVFTIVGPLIFHMHFRGSLAALSLISIQLRH